MKKIILGLVLILAGKANATTTFVYGGPVTTLGDIIHATQTAQATATNTPTPTITQTATITNTPTVSPTVTSVAITGSFNIMSANGVTISTYNGASYYGFALAVSLTASSSALTFVAKSLMGGMNGYAMTSGNFITIGSGTLEGGYSFSQTNSSNGLTGGDALRLSILNGVPSPTETAIAVIYAVDFFYNPVPFVNAPSDLFYACYKEENGIIAPRPFKIVKNYNAESDEMRAFKMTVHSWLYG